MLGVWVGWLLGSCSVECLADCYAYGCVGVVVVVGGWWARGRCGVGVRVALEGFVVVCLKQYMFVALVEEFED